MSMRVRIPLNEHETPVHRSNPSEDQTSQESPNVLVSHGIHRGRFPIGGMRIREAREVLGPLINISPEAVAVINGRPVEEEEVIDGDNVSMLSFVKPSALKG